MIRLCIDARMINSSGIGTCIRNLIPFLSQPPFDTTILIGKESPYSGKKIEFQAPIYSFTEQLLFSSKIPSSDLFWSPHFNTPWLPIKSRRRVVTIHDVCHLALPFPKFKKIVAKTLLKRACGQSDLVVTDSYFSKGEIEKHLSFEKVDVIYPGVDLNEFYPMKPVEDFKNRHHLGDEVFLFIGNFKTHKNLKVLLQAFELLDRKSSQLVLVGKQFDTDLNGLLKQCRIKDQVIVFNEAAQSELPLLYNSAYAFVFPSLYEGFGLPPLEAMASGCPVIASNAASIPEVCKEAALYFSPNSPIELTEKMGEILDNRQLRENLIVKGLLRSKEFSWEETSKGYRALFEKLCTN